MKKSILFLSMLLVFSHSLWAQLQSYTKDASDSLGISLGGSVVRNYNDEYAIGFFKKKDTSYFYAVETASGMNSFTQGNRIQVNGSWDVKDIFFHNGEAFFCGSIGGNGIVGHFPVSSLIYGSGGIPIESRIIPGITLRRLVAYSDGTSYRVAAIDSTMIVSCDFTTSSCFYHNFPLNAGELVYDVLLKGDHLLYVGTDTTHNCITVRISLCASPTHVSRPFRYRPDSPTTHVIPTGSIATLLPDNQLAVVHQVANEQSNIELDLLTIQLSNMLCTDRQAFVNLHRVHYHDLKYIPTTQRLELLYTDFVQYDTYVLEWQPYQSTTYSANVLQPVLRYSSMDRIGDKCFFMVSGFQWMLQNTLVGSWANSCEMHWWANVINKKEHTTDLEENEIVLSFHTISPNYFYNITPTSFNVNTDCIVY